MKFEKVSFSVWKRDALRVENYREKLFHTMLMNHKPQPEKYKFSEFEYYFFGVWKLIKLPQRATKYSAGYDFFSPVDIILYPGEVITIPTGIKWNPEDRMDMVLSIYPRSSLGRDYSLREPNIVSIIDADYYGIESNEGHIFINLKNEGQNGPVKIPARTAYAQGIITQYFTTSDDFTTSIRTGGFGSTGNLDTTEKKGER
jgi:dUTP pyrophosphatase